MSCHGKVSWWFEKLIRGARTTEIGGIEALSIGDHRKVVALVLLNVLTSSWKRFRLRRLKAGMEPIGSYGQLGSTHVLSKDTVSLHPNKSYMSLMLTRRH